MISITPSFFIRFLVNIANRCKQQWQKRAFQRDVLHAEVPHSENKQPEYQTVVTTQWPINEHSATNHEEKSLVVEVAVYPKNTHDRENVAYKAFVNPSNYTREGDDPNLLITHYPPSNRLH